MKPRILIIDDEEFFTKAVKQNLEATGDYQVFTVNDSTQAVHMIHEIMPDLILLDIIMPKVEGADILKTMEEDPVLRSIPVLVVTAMIEPGDTSENGVEKFGEHILLAKPIETESLIKCIEEKLSDHDGQESYSSR